MMCIKIHYTRSTAPDGWLVADGAVVSRSAYAALFAAIGTTFGVGDGATTFGIPDLRGEFIRGLDNGRGVDAARTLGSSQAQAIQSHSHDASTGSAAAGVGFSDHGGAVGTAVYEGNPAYLNSDGTSHTHTRLRCSPPVAPRPGPATSRCSRVSSARPRRRNARHGHRSVTRGSYARRSQGRPRRRQYHPVPG